MQSCDLNMAIKYIPCIIFSFILMNGAQLKAQSKVDKKRLQVIQKSLEKKSIKQYEDTLYYLGKAVGILKKGENKEKFLNNPYRDLFSVNGKLLMNINLYNTYTIPFSHTITTFWINVKTESGDKKIRVIQNRLLDQIELIEYLIQEKILTEGAINPDKFVEFILEHDVKSVSFIVGCECESPNMKLHHLDAKENYLSVIPLSRTYKETHIAAVGDKFQLFSNGQLLDSFTLGEKTSKVTVSAGCDNLIQE